MKRAAQIQFVSQASPEVLRQARPQNDNLLLKAERRLAAGDPEGAQKLAQKALDETGRDSGRALLISGGSCYRESRHRRRAILFLSERCSPRMSQS